MILALLCGCSKPPNTSASDKSASSEVKATGTVVITSDFGKKIILERDIEIKAGTTALDALQLVASLKTKYGGGFVSSINGISSEYGGINSNKKDWFLYINGMESNTGASDYVLHPGDVEHWDFHDWSFHQWIPAIIDSFPGAFKSGYGGNSRPTVIAYASGLQAAANNLAQKLNASGVKVTSQSLSDLAENAKESANLLLLGTSDDQLILELNQAWQRLGFFAHFENRDLVTLQASGQAGIKYGADTGWIQSSQNPWNPNGTGADQNVVWLISGTDVAGVNAAVDVLLEHPEELKYAFAVVISGGKIIKLPQ